MRRTTAVALVALCVAGTACAKDSKPGTPVASSAPPTTTAPTPSPTATEATFGYGTPFYSDDFADKTKGWTEKDTAQVAYTVHDDYAQPLYTITVKEARLQAFPHPEFRGITKEQLADYEVSATIQTTLSVGHEDLFGVTCRDLDDQRYSLSIGYDLRRTGEIPWRILKHGPDGRRVLNEGTATAPGGSAFRVAATCAGGKDGGPAHLVLKVNDTEVGRAQDTEAPLTEGLAGIYAFSDDGKTTVNVLGFAVRPATIG